MALQAHSITVPATGLAQSPDPLDPAEALLATVGCTKVLTGNMPIVGVMLQRQALSMPTKIKKLANDLVADKLPKNVTMPRHLDYNTWLDLLTSPIKEQQIENVVLKFPPNVHDQAVQFSSLVARIHQQLGQLFPTQDYQTVLGPVKIEPPSDKVWKFFNQYWVINDPLQVFPLMQCGALLPDQVGAVQGYYPSLYEHMKSALLDALVKHKGGKDALSIPERLNRSISTFLGQKMVPYGSNKHLITPEMVNPPPSPVTQSKPSSSLESPAQKAATP